MVLDAIVCEGGAARPSGEMRVCHASRLRLAAVLLLLQPGREKAAEALAWPASLRVPSLLHPELAQRCGVPASGDWIPPTEINQPTEKYEGNSTAHLPCTFDFR